MPSNKTVHLKSTEQDYAALDWIKKKHALVSLAAAVLFSIEMQAKRQKDDEREPEYLEILEKTLGNVVFQGPAAKIEGDQLSLRLPQDCAAFSEEIRVHHEFLHTSQALRLSVRVQALLDGFKLPKSGW